MTKRMKNLLIGVVVGAILVIAGIITGAVLISNANRKAPTYVSTAAELERAVNDDIDKPIVLKNNIVYTGDLTANKLFDLEMNNYNVIVDGKLTIKTDEAGSMYIGDGKNSLFTREIVKAHQIEIDAVNASVTWNANVTLKDGHSAGDFKIAVSDHTFVFNGIILNGENEQVDTAMTVSKGRLVIEDNSAGGGAKAAKVVVPAGAEKVVIENKAEETAVNVVTEASVTVAGVVEIDVADGASGVVISTPENNEIPTKINIQSGTADSVNAGGAEITVGEDAVIEGSVTGDKVINNGSVGGDIVADDVVDNSLVNYKTDKKAELETYATSKGQSNYSSANWTIIQGYVTSGKTAIDGAADKAAVDSAVTAAKNNIDAVKTISEEQAEELAAYKTEKKAELETYATNKGEDNYSTANWTAIQGYVTSGKTAIDEAADKAAVDSAFTAAKNNIDAVKTISEEQAEELAAYKTEKKAELETYATSKGEGNYSTANWTIIQGYVTSGKTAIDEADDKAAVDSAVTAAKNNIDAVKTISEEQAEELAAYKTEKKTELETYATNKGEDNYSTANWTAIQGYVTSGKTAIDGADDKAAVDSAVTAAKNNIDAVKTISEEQAEELAAYKTEKKAELDEIVSALTEADYYAADWTIIQGYVTSGKTAIDGAADKATVDSAVTAAKTGIEEVEIKSSIVAAAKAELQDYAAETDYYAEEWAAVENAVNAGNSAIDAATSKTSVAEAVAAAKAEIDEIATKSEKLAAVKAAAVKEIEDAVAALDSADYSSANWTAITDEAAEAKNAINAVTVDNIAQITTIKTAALEAVAEVKTIAEELADYKTEKKNALDGIVSALTEADYYAADWTTIQGYVTSGKTAIEEAADIAAVDEAYAAAEAEVKAVEKKADVVAEANSALEAYAAEKGEENYTAADWAAIGSIIDDAAADITAADSREKVAEAVAKAKSDIDGVATAPVRIEGKIGYATLSEAIAAAETGDVIKIYSDINEDEGNINYYLTKAVTVEGVVSGGKKPAVYGAFSVKITGVADGSDVAVIKNLEIVHNGLKNEDNLKDTKGAVVVYDGGLTLTGNYIRLINPAPANVDNSPSGLQLSRAADSVSTAAFNVENNTFGAYPQYSDATNTIATAIQVSTNYVVKGELVYGYIEVDDEAIYKANAFETAESLEQYVLYGNYNWSVRDDGTPVGYKYVVFGSIFAYNRDGGDGVEGGTVIIAGDITLTNKAYSVKSGSEFIIEEGVVFDGNGLILDVYGSVAVRGEIKNVTLVKHPGAVIAAEGSGVIADSVTIMEVGADTVVLSSDEVSSDTVFDADINYIVNFTEVNTTVLKIALAAQVKSMTVNLAAGVYSIVEQIDIVSPAVINGNGAEFNVVNSAVDNTAFNVNTDSAEFYDLTINGDKNNRIAIAIAKEGATSVVADGVNINMHIEANNVRAIGYMCDDATAATLVVKNSKLHMGEDYENTWGTVGTLNSGNRGLSLYSMVNGKVDVIDSEIMGFKYTINVGGNEKTDSDGASYYEGAGLVINVSGSKIYGWGAFNIWASGVEVNIKDGSYIRGINNMTGSSNSFSTIVFNADLYEQFDGTIIKNGKLTVTDSTVAAYTAPESYEGGIRQELIRIDGNEGFELILNNAKFVDESNNTVSVLFSGTNDNAFLAEIEAAVTQAGGSYTVYNAAGEVIDMPLAPVSVNETLIADATAAAESIGEVYNKYVNKGELTIEQIKADYPAFEFYVKLGRTAFENTVLTLGGTAYSASDEMKLSIGNNTFVKEPVWYYDADESVVYVSAVALAAETYTTSSTVVFTNYPFVIEGEMPSILSVTPAVRGNGGSSIDNVQDTFTGKTFDYTLKDGTDAFVLSYNGVESSDMIVTKKVITAGETKTVSYGFTYPDAVNGGYGLMYYPKYGATFEDNGTFEIDYSFYVVGKGISINKVNVTVDIREIYVSDAAEIKDAFANAKDGDTIILDGDITAVEGDHFLTLRADAADLGITLNLNGHRLDYRLDLRSTTLENKESGSKLTVSIENGTIGSATGYNALGTAIEYGMLIAGGNVDLTLDKVIAYGCRGGIYENGSWAGSTIKATGCTFQGAETFGAYLAGGHTATFEGCVFTGTVGAYVKSGDKTFTNCTITGSGEYEAPSYNGNGANGSGSGIVVDSTVGYQQPMSVLVVGGSVTSEKGYAVEEVSNAKEGTDEVCYSEVIVTGGAALEGALGAVYSENGVVTVNAEEAGGGVLYVSSEKALNNALNNVPKGGTVTLTENIVSSTGTIQIHSAAAEKDFTLDINGHDLVGEVWIISQEKDGTVYNNLKITVTDSTASAKAVGQGTIGSVAENMYGIIPQGADNLNVTLKNIHVIGEWALYTNGTFAGAVINAENCKFETIENDLGICSYLASNHTVTFKECEFSGLVGVYIKSGNTVFENCTLYGYGEYAAPSYNGNGADASGSALVVDSTVGYQLPFTVTVNGGSLKSDFGYAVEEVSNAKEGVDKQCGATVSVSGAELSGALGAVYSENGVVSVNTDNGEVMYVSTEKALSNAFANVSIGGTIVLTNDIAPESGMIKADSKSSEKNFTLDINGHKLVAELYLMSAEVVSNKVVTFDYSMNATVIDSSAEEGKTGKGLIGDSSQKCYYGIIPQGQANLTVAVKNVNALGYWGGIHTNGMYEGATVTADYCAFTGYCDVLDDAGLGGYLAANHTVVFNDCTFTGPVGIYIKSGNTTFNNCLITGNGEYYDPIYNGSGTSGSGSGIVIDSTVGYKQPMNVEVNGGEIASVYGYAVEEVSNAKEGVETVCYATVNIGSDVKLTAGALGTVRSENGVVAGADEIYTSTADGIQNAVDNGVSKIILNDDVDGLNAVITGGAVSINLNGKNVTTENGFAFYVDGGNLTVNGNGNVRVKGGSANDNVFYAVNGGTITINGGDFSVGADKDGLGNSCVYAANGTVVINGGTFATDAAYNNFYYVLNLQNKTQSSIVVNGGTFVNYNPEVGDDADGGNFVADGCKVISEEKDGMIYYTVVANDFDDNATVVTEDGTLADAIANAADGATIRLGADMTVDSTITIDKNIILDLNGRVITSTADGARAFTVTSGKLTVKNGTVTSNGSGTNKEDASGSYGAVRVEGGELVMYDVTLENSRPWGSAVKMVGGKAIFRNVTINSVYGGGVEVGGAEDGSSVATADFYECNFTQTDEFMHNSNLISVCYGGTANIHSGNYSGVYGLYVYNSGGTINMYGGKVIGQKESVHIDSKTGVSSVTVEAGKLTGSVKLTLEAQGAVTFTAKEGVSLNGKAFSADFTTEEAGTVTEAV